jgi:tetratricopeptide (TPR) repeat protein
MDYEVRMVLGDIFCELNEYRFGLEELNTALSYKPDDPDILFKVGNAYLMAGKDCKKKGNERERILKNAKDKLEEALEIQDRSKVTERGKIRYLIGKTLLEMGRYEEAIPHLRILAKKKETTLPALYLGYTHLKCNAHEECESQLRKLIDRLDSDGNKNDVKSDRSYGREYGVDRNINEILARAYIYLAYSYVERGANLYDAWKLAFIVFNLMALYIEISLIRLCIAVISFICWVKHYKSQDFIKHIEDKGNREENRDSNDISSVNVCYGINLTSIDSGPIYPASGRAGKSQDYWIEAVFDRNDWHRKRKAKAHLAECAGTICYKSGDTKATIDYLEASIALYPDAGAYLNLAKAKERKILLASAEESEKALIRREIQELCLHVKALDIRDDHKKDLEEFEKQMQEKKVLLGISAEVKPPAKEV